MNDALLAALSRRFPLSEKPVGDFAVLSASGMRFAVAAYEAAGLGHVSAMRAAGFFGAMKMETLIVVPQQRDLPLYSFDRIAAMGSYTLLAELYDTDLTAVDLSALDAAAARFPALADRDPGAHWYDGIRLPQSLSKRGRKKQAAQLDELALEHFSAYLDPPAAPTADLCAKRDKTAAYVRGLLEHGGPPTDVFKKALGAEKTAELFETVLFGLS